MTLKVTIIISFCSLTLLSLLFSVMTISGIFLPSSSNSVAYAQLYSNTTQVWTEKQTADDII